MEKETRGKGTSIEELRSTDLTSEFGKRKVRVAVAKLKVTILEMTDEMDAAVQNKEFLKAADVKTEIDAKVKEREELERMLAAAEEGRQRTALDTESSSDEEDPQLERRIADAIARSNEADSDEENVVPASAEGRSSPSAGKRSRSASPVMASSKRPRMSKGRKRAESPPSSSDEEEDAGRKQKQKKRVAKQPERRRSRNKNKGFLSSEDEGGAARAAALNSSDEEAPPSSTKPRARGGGAILDSDSDGGEKNASLSRSRGRAILSDSD